MSFIKDLLTTENFTFLELNISVFILTVIFILIALCIALWIKKRSVANNLIKSMFISLTIITFMFAFFNALTGEYLFSQQENMRLYMLIAAVALWIYLIDTIKELFAKKK